MSATSSTGHGFSPAPQPWERGSVGVLSLLMVLATRPYSIHSGHVVSYSGDENALILVGFSPA